jgi:UDP-N-acetylglucosamine 2-epimerase (non-hydrolysing)
MPLLPTAELGCPGRPDPQLHVRDVARAIGATLEATRLVVVQGDTSSALGGALGSAQAGRAVAHVEAGLRSHDRLNPWPEEDFRITIDGLADLLFAPTELSAANLRREGVGGQIEVTGNTGIDALLDRLPLLPMRNVDGGEHRLLVTCHRRESWGEGLEDIASSLLQIARRKDVSISFVLHPNPRVADDMRQLLGGVTNVRLRDPCSHMEMLQAMRDSDLILSDSGGMQEEAPTLGVPLLILRDRTERPEGIASGNLKLVGRDPDSIRATVEALLDNPAALRSMGRRTFPYGDGRASQRIAASIENWFRRDEPRSPWYPSATGPAEPLKQFASRR